jgi:hypothetical protein
VSSYPLSVRLERNGVLLVQEKQDLRRMNVPGLLVVGLSRRPSLDSLIIPLTGKTGRPVEMTYPRSEFLPEDALGWEGADYVVWHDMPPELPDERSLDALALWVETGGEIIIIAGPWLAGKSFPGRLVPGTVGGPEQVDGLTRYFLSEYDGKDEGLIQEMAVGLGRVRYISWDAVNRELPPAFREEFLSRILEDEHAVRKIPVEELESLVAGTAFQNSESLLPPVHRFLIVPLLFLLASGGILIAGRRSVAFHMRIAQLTVPAALAVICAAAVYFKDYQPGTVIRRLDLLITGNQGAVHRVSSLSVVSTENRKMDLRLPEEGILRYSRETNLEQTRMNGERILKNLELTAWKAVEVSVIRTQAGAEGVHPVPETGAAEEYRNNSGERLFDPVLITRGSAVSLGSVWEPGEVLVPAGDQSFPQKDVTPSGTAEGRWTGEFPDLPERLAANLDGNWKFVMARGEGSTVVIHLGGSP